MQLWLTTVEGWLTESINKHNQKTMVLIAEDEQGERFGFATVSHSTHFTGQRQAHIGEPATSETVEGRGVGTALVEACEQWTREQGYTLLTLISAFMTKMSPGPSSYKLTLIPSCRRAKLQDFLKHKISGDRAAS